MVFGVCSGCVSPVKAGREGSLSFRLFRPVVV